jgi:hypothetical protein
VVTGRQHAGRPEAVPPEQGEEPRGAGRQELLVRGLGRSQPQQAQVGQRTGEQGARRRSSLVTVGGSQEGAARGAVTTSRVSSTASTHSRSAASPGCTSRSQRSRARWSVTVVRAPCALSEHRSPGAVHRTWPSPTAAGGTDDSRLPALTSSSRAWSAATVTSRRSRTGVEADDRTVKRSRTSPVTARGGAPRARWGPGRVAHAAREGHEDVRVAAVAWSLTGTGSSPSSVSTHRLSTRRSPW